MAERRFMAVHDAECEYRQLVCPHCGKGISARHAQKHELNCQERRVTCERCGAKVLERRLYEHEEAHCGQGLFLCEFAKYGCSERATRAELDRHCEEDAPRHLRLVMFALEGIAASYKEWYKEVDSVKRAMVDRVKVRTGSTLTPTVDTSSDFCETDALLPAHHPSRVRLTSRTRECSSVTWLYVAVGVRDIGAAGAEVRRVEEAGKAEVEKLRVGLAELRTYYEEEVSRLQRQVARVKVDSDARVRDLAAENEALRQALATKLTRADGDEWIAEMRLAREACEAEVETTRDDMNRHRQRWERDVSRVHEEFKRTKDECKERIERVVQRLEDHTANDHHRTEKIWEEVQEANKEFIAELDDLGSRQRDLEQRWQESNELLRGEPAMKAEEAWAERAEVTTSRPTGIGSAGQKALAKFRAQGAAQLLFGKGSKAGGGGDGKSGTARGLKTGSKTTSKAGSAAGSAAPSVIGRPGSARPAVGKGGGGLSMLASSRAASAAVAASREDGSGALAAAGIAKVGAKSRPKSAAPFR